MTIVWGFICGIVCSCLLYGIYYFYKKAHPEQKTTQQDLDAAQQRLYSLQQQVGELYRQREELSQSIQEKKDILEAGFQKEKQETEQKIQENKDKFNYVSEQYVYALEKSYEKAEKEYHEKVSQLQQQEQSYTEQIKKYNDEIESLKASLYAGAQAHLREQEAQEQLNFYMLQVSDDDLEDIEKLNELKKSIHHPKAISKVIWTVYFQKEASALCGRVLGSFTVCGIYKITNIKTHECYIGQSKDISTRWKDHIKCGLGIDTPSTNKLYKAMLTDGVWNFTFELLEECDKSMLNTKEAFWIDMYKTTDYGYNTMKGTGLN